MKTLKDTVDGMLSDDWKERLVAEIEQADIRMYQLAEHMREIGEDSPEYSLLQAQLDHQSQYTNDLIARATTFGIEYKLPTMEELEKTLVTNTGAKNDAFFYTFMLLMILLMKE